MTERLLARVEDLAAQAQASKVQLVAQKLRALFGNAAVTVDEAQVIVSGRGITRRWLIDPRLRFLGGGLK